MHAATTGRGSIRLLKAIRASGVDTRFYQASSSEMFGSAPPPQSETTPFHPRSPYACAKVFALHVTVNYREAHGLLASSGMLMNHEGPRRGKIFVNRKITGPRLGAPWAPRRPRPPPIGGGRPAGRRHQGFEALFDIMVDADVALFEGASVSSSRSKP